jgi:hypothetical protein
MRWSVGDDAVTHDPPRVLHTHTHTHTHTHVREVEEIRNGITDSISPMASEGDCERHEEESRGLCAKCYHSILPEGLEKTALG